MDNAPNATRAVQDPFFVGSSLAIFSGFLAVFCLPHIGQDTIDYEDARFRQYLMEHGYDTSKMGLYETESESSLNVQGDRVAPMHENKEVAHAV